MNFAVHIPYTRYLYLPSIELQKQVYYGKADDVGMVYNE